MAIVRAAAVSGRIAALCPLGATRANASPWAARMLAPDRPGGSHRPRQAQQRAALHFLARLLLPEDVQP